MKKHFIYILACLIALVLYELYLIGLYSYRDFQIDTALVSLGNVNTAIEKRNEEKQLYNEYVRTDAYKAYVLKATQNKKLPGEEVFNIVDDNDIASNAEINVNTMLYQVQKKEESPMRNMSNPQKWVYLLKNMH